MPRLCWKARTAKSMSSSKTSEGESSSSRPTRIDRISETAGPLSPCRMEGTRHSLREQTKQATRTTGAQTQNEKQPERTSRLHAARGGESLRRTATPRIRSDAGRVDRKDQRADSMKLTRALLGLAPVTELTG